MNGLYQVQTALAFVILKHDGQRRKYTNEPYITHLIAVASRVDAADGDLDMVKAALCHDVLEDTEATYDEVQSAIGIVAANYVLLLTDSGREKGNRATRKAMDRARLGAAPPPVQTIKLADLLDNTMSIVQRDPDFAKVYIPEKRALLEVLTYGDKRMLKEALHVVEAAEEKLLSPSQFPVQEKP